MASSDSESGFEVDQVLNQRKRKGVVEYLIRWKGFGKSEDSWEPLKNLSNCASAMAEYMKLTKTPKKSTTTKSRSRSRSTSRSRTTKTKSSRSRTPRARSKTPKGRGRSKTPSKRTPVARSTRSRSRSRSTSRGRTMKTKESPSRQSKKTEVVTRTSTNREPGRVEKKTEIVRSTLDDSKPHEVKTTRVMQSRLEVKTVEDKVDGKTISVKREGGFTDTLNTLWQSADTAALIIFVCVSIIALSFVVENYCSPSDLWKYMVGIYTAIVGAIVGSWKWMCGGLHRVWETNANFTRDMWKKATSN